MKTMALALIAATIIPLLCAGSASAMTRSQWIALHRYNAYNYAPVAAPIYPVVNPLAMNPYAVPAYPPVPYRHWHHHRRF